MGRGKKFLSLALGLTLLLGSLVLGANAGYTDFTDKDKITHPDAVRLLVDLHVVAGKEDGSFFDPQGTLTRAEAAKLICVVLNSGEEPALGNSGKLSYSDTQNNWGKWYIEYVTKKNIVAGDGQGHFKPNETVTATQLAKMLLVSLGYDAKTEGMVGDGWSSKIDALAKKNSLYDGLNTTNTSVPLSRDDAAQMIYNMLFTKTVQYSTTGSGANKTTKTALNQYFELDLLSGVVVANDEFSLSAKKTDVAAKDQMKLFVRKQNRTETEASQKGGANAWYTGNTVSLPVACENEWVGKEIQVLVKRYQKSGQSIYGSMELTGRNKEASSVDGLTAAAAEKLLNQAGLRFSNDVVVVNNGRASGVQSAEKAKALLQEPLGGIQRRMIDNNGDGSIDCILITQPVLTKVTEVRAAQSITLEGFGTIAMEDLRLSDSAGADDLVLACRYGPTVTYVEKAETVFGKVTAYQQSAGTVTINGTSYAKSAVTCAAEGLVEVPFSKDLMDGKSHRFYLDGQGNLIAYDGPADEPVISAAGYGLVLEADVTIKESGAVTGTVRLLTQDGSQKTYAISAWEGLGDSEESPQCQIVSYQISTKGTVSLVSTQANGTHSLSEKAIRSNRSYTQDGHSIAAGSSTLYFFWDGEGCRVVKGVQNLPAREESGALIREVAYQETNGTYTALAVYVEGVMEQVDRFVYVLDGPIETNPTGMIEYVYHVTCAGEGTGAIDTILSRTAYQKTGLYHQTGEKDNAILTVDASIRSGSIQKLDSTGATLRMGGQTFDVAENVAILDVMDPEMPAVIQWVDLRVGDQISAALNQDGAIQEIYLIEG